MVTGIIIGFVLAFFFRGIIMKLLIVGFLVVVAFWLFGNGGA
jgi:ABC-type iron transport system FetAB permease component